MSTTQTVLVDPRSAPATELELQPKDVEAEAPPTTDEPPIDAVAQEVTATPVPKLIVAGFSFFCAGANDGTLGPLIPYMLTTFGISTGEVAVLYASSFLGWLVAAITNPILAAHTTLGQILAVGAVLQLLAQCLRPWSPFPIFCITFFIQALGMAYQDSHSNTFVSGLKNVPHRWLSFIHACYAFGTFVGPLIATAISTTSNSGSVIGWRRTYFFLIGIGLLNVAGVATTFKDTLWTLQRLTKPRSPRNSKLAVRDLIEPLRLKAVWIISLFYFFELGCWMTAGGWVVEFLTTVRGGKLSKMGYVSAGYSGGVFLGRILLSEPTFRFGERRMLLIYSVICVGLQLVFWLQPNIIASATVLSFMGFLFGPFFATVSESYWYSFGFEILITFQGMSVASKILPKKHLSAALGFIFVLAQAGGAIFPSITGLIATKAGVAVLQPIVLALMVVGGLCWWMVPQVPARDE
ncbi:major facilitator superfamily domain-containing protein [Xylariales sp. PMI_506]|nr:major facilitator superfamily domain-containing protein [Xylariales sp. PMI_506]